MRDVGIDILEQWTHQYNNTAYRALAWTGLHGVDRSRNMSKTSQWQRTHNFLYYMVTQSRIAWV